MIIFSVIVSFLSLVLCEVHSARILAFFPTPSISHQLPFRPLTQELARRGHEVVVVTPDPAYKNNQAPTNLTEIDVHDLSYKIWRESFLTEAIGKEDDIFTQIEIAVKLLWHVFEAQLKTEEVQEIIFKKKGEFDLLIIEACVKSALALSHIFKVPVIQISSFGALLHNQYDMGMPSHPLLFPTSLHQRLYNLTNWEKLQQLYNHWWLEYLLSKVEEEEDKKLKKVFGPEIPTINELSNNINMLFLNVHSIWVDNQPTPPSVVYIGGIHQNPGKELPKELQTYLDSSKNGVIYLSFGTNVKPSLLPPEKIKMLIQVFSKLPYDVLWKWDKDTLPGKSDNIRIFKWLPQSDLLRHPNVKLFITQGGLQSTDEAISAGVPLIGIPMLADQWYNVEKYVRHNIGLKLDMVSLTEDELTTAIETIMKDESYRNNIAELKTLMYDQPQTALERAVWWTEYVLRHGGAKYLRPPTANISWSQYLELELVALVACLLTSIVVLLVITVYYVWKLVVSPFCNIKIKVS